MNRFETPLEFHLTIVLLALRARHDESYRKRTPPEEWTVDGGCWCDDCHPIRIALDPEKTLRQSKMMKAQWDREMAQEALDSPPQTMIR